MLNPFQFTAAGQALPDRRFDDRRQSQEEEPARSGRAWKRYAVISIVLILLCVIARKWRYVVYGPAYLARAHWADRSDLYLGKTNAIPNRILVEQARTYLTDIDHVDASGNITAPEALRPLNVHLDMAWFKNHVPDRVDFNPFISPEGRFVVTWLYYPGCQKTVWKSPRVDTDWYNVRGRPCFPVCRVSVLMAPSLRMTDITVNAISQ